MRGMTLKVQRGCSGGGSLGRRSGLTDRVIRQDLSTPGSEEEQDDSATRRVGDLQIRLQVLLFRCRLVLDVRLTEQAASPAYSDRELHLAHWDRPVRLFVLAPGVRKVRHCARLGSCDHRVRPPPTARSPVERTQLGFVFSAA